MNKKKVLVIICSVVLLAGLAFGYWHFFIHKPKTASNTSPLDPSIIRYNPPTTEEKKASDQTKQRIVEEQAKPPQASKQATVVIADASQYGQNVEVRAFITNQFESGTCVVSFTSQVTGQIVQRTVDASPSGTTTQCSSLSVPRSAFSSTGTWNVTVVYQSKTSGGSASSSLEIK